MEPSELIRINELVLKCLDQSISRQEFEELNRRLVGDSSARLHYKEIMSICLWIRRQKMNRIPGGLHAEGYDPVFWEEMLEAERTAPAIPVTKEPDPDLRPLPNQVIVRQTNKVSLFAALLSLAALIVLIAYIQVYPRYIPDPVATVHNRIDARFGNDEDFPVGSRLTNRQDPFRLEKGIIELQLDEGAEVVIESPAGFRMVSSGEMVLDYGRLYAKVPPSAAGFTIETPSSSVIDLGTEFGIKVDVDGASDVHMFRGKASLIPGQKGRTRDSQMLTAGFAKRIGLEGQVQDIPIQEEGFVRMISSRANFAWRGQKTLDLADMVGGGNGWGTGQIGIWLNLKTGEKGTDLVLNPSAQLSAEELGDLERRFTDNRYRPVLKLPYVDGIFSPDGGTGPVQVSSQGHFWSGCPDTSGIYFEDIFNGSTIETSYRHALILNGQQYGSRERPAIALHSNAGITFDLAAIRADMPGMEITRFQALCGVSEEAGRPANKTDFRVLADGTERFAAKGLHSNSGAREVSVPLGREDRFLTLVVTDGDMNPNNDWGFYALPRLEIENAK